MPILICEMPNHVRRAGTSGGAAAPGCGGRGPPLALFYCGERGHGQGHYNVDGVAYILLREPPAPRGFKRHRTLHRMPHFRIGTGYIRPFTLREWNLP